MYEWAKFYASRGLGVIPIEPATKRPLAKWKEFQQRHPTHDDVHHWWTSIFPQAGIAAILGPVSGLLVVDVDGTEAREELVRRLGVIPTAPMVLTGSAERDRFHLLFRHPNLPTGAKATPWHPQLEFRGHGDLAILPPSTHKSGNRYWWADGRSLADVPTPELPTPLLDALAMRARSRSATAPQDRPTRLVAIDSCDVLGSSYATRDFLTGLHATGPNWNSKLFNAACDLAGIGMHRDDALDLLLAGAQPWDSHEREKAIATVKSAFAAPRVPGRKLHSDDQPKFTETWSVHGMQVSQVPHVARRQLPPSASVQLPGGRQ
jgi:hypothetical protein